jgi:hypothetical protein
VLMETGDIISPYEKKKMKNEKYCSDEWLGG